MKDVYFTTVNGAMAIQNAIDSKMFTVEADPKTDHFLKLNVLLGKGESFCAVSDLICRTEYGFERYHK